jgi:hypothetical protein
VVEIDAESANSFFDTLQDWENIIVGEGLDKHPALRGPRP